MPPIDPQQLLQALGPLLTDTGGIRGAQEASRITRLMKDASKLVTRCVYLNILRATDSKDALEKFMEVGGWDILNTWLEMARDDNNEPLLGELLEVYLTMPVSVVLLKQNSAAKTIKQLSKTEKEKIKKTSALLVESWTKTIREQNSTADNNEEDKRRLKKKMDKEIERDKDLEKNDKENDKKDGKDSEKAKIRERDSRDRERDSKDSKDRDSKDKDKDSKDRSHKDRKDRDKHKDKDRDKAKRDKSKTSASSKDSSASKPQSIDSSKNKDSSSASRRPSSADDSKSSSASSSSTTTTSTTLNKSLEVDAGKDEPKRPKTVKQLVTKFRSTGLFDEEEEEEAESVKKKVDKLPLKRVSLDMKNENESMEKKPRLQLTMPTLIPANLDGTVTTPPEVTHGRIKLIAPKRAPAHEIQESNVFMDSLQQATFPSGRKSKKKLVSPSATTTPAMFKNSSATSPPSASSPPSATSPPSSTQASEAGPTSPPLLSPTTVMAQKLPSVPSFYRDTLDDMPESTSDTKKDTEQENESPPPVEEMEITEAEQEIENKDGDQPVESTEKKSPEDKVAEVPSVTNTEAAQKLGNGKKAKKSVSWAREAHLEDFFYFEMDENERENVNRPKSFTDMKKADILLDRRAMESAKRFNNDTMVEVLQWKRPKLIDNAIVFETGINSVERRVQMEREQVVLCALFFNKVPDTPIEPDADISSDKVETKIIPLEDENGSCTEYEHTYAFNDPSSLPYDPEFGGLPLQNHVPAINQVVNSIPGVNMHMANNMVPMTVNMGNMRGHMNIPAPISHILNTLQQQAQETRDPIMQNLQGMLTNVLQNTNPQDSSMLMERILNALEPFRTQIPGLSNLINSVTANSMDSSMAAPRFMMPNQIGNTRHGLLGSAPPGFNMMAGTNMRPALPGQTPVMGNSGAGMGGNSNFFMGGGGGGGGNMRMGGPPSQWRGSNRSRPYSKRGGHRNIVCQFFVKKGLCKYGDSCQFIHPNPNS